MLGQIEHRVMPGIVVEMDLMTRQGARIVEVEYEVRLLSGEHRLDMAGVYFELRHVAEGMQQADAAGGGEQEGEHVTQAQVVIDVAQQHQHQHKGEAETLARGQDVDAALVEHQRAGLDGAAKSPVAEFLFECGWHWDVFRNPFSLGLPLS